MKKPISMRMDEDIVAKCKKIAKDKKTTFTQLVTDILFDFIMMEKKGGRKNAV